MVMMIMMIIIVMMMIIIIITIIIMMMITIMIIIIIIIIMIIIIMIIITIIIMIKSIYLPFCLSCEALPDTCRLNLELLSPGDNSALGGRRLLYATSSPRHHITVMVSLWWPKQE